MFTFMLYFLLFSECKDTTIFNSDQTFLVFLLFLTFIRKVGGLFSRVSILDLGGCFCPKKGVRGAENQRIKFNTLILCALSHLVGEW